MPDLLPCVEISSLVSTSTHAPSFCVSVCPWASGQPHSCICPQQGKNRVESLNCDMRGVYVGKLSSVSCQERLPGQGRSNFLLWECLMGLKHYFTQCLVMFLLSLETLIPIYWVGKKKSGVFFCRMLWKDAKKMFWSTQYNEQTEVFGVLLQD